jgi:phage gp36-like protein
MVGRGIMSYANHADVEERLGTATCVELTDDTGSGVADEDKVAEAVRAAEAEIDSYLGRRYAVPLDVAEEPELANLLKRLTVDLAEYRLRGRRPPIADDVRRTRDAVLQWLQRAGGGEVVLPVTHEVAGNPTLGAAGEVTGPLRVLARDLMEDF